MINTIVTGVDDSETAALAARKAAELAKVHDAELHVISAYGNQEVRTLRAGGDVLQINQIDKATQVAKGVADSLRAEFPNLTITSDAALGQPGEALVSRLVVSELESDALAVPTVVSSPESESVASLVSTRTGAGSSNKHP